MTADHETALEAVDLKAAFEIAEIFADLRTDVGVGGYRRCPFVFAVLAGKLMGRADEKTGVGLAQNLAHAQLMLRRAIRMEKQHGHRLDAFFL